MQSELLKDNMSLSLRIKELEGLLAFQSQKVELMYSTIKLLSHFVPTIHEKFEDEFENLCNLETAFLTDLKLRNSVDGGGS